MGWRVVGRRYRRIPYTNRYIPDGDVLVPTVAWARQVGSGGDDNVVGGSVAALSPLLFGFAPSSIDGTAVTGPFFFSGSATGTVAVYQVGEESAEILRHGFYGDGSAWLIGDGPFEYRVEVNDDDADELIRTRVNSQAGFALGYVPRVPLVRRCRPMMRMTLPSWS